MWRRMERINWTEKITNMEVLRRAGDRKKCDEIKCAVEKRDRGKNDVSQNRFGNLEKPCIDMLDTLIKRTRMEQ